MIAITHDKFVYYIKIKNMKKLIISFFCVFILFGVESKSQSINIDFAATANTLIKDNKANLPNIQMALVADSFSVSSSTIHIYFNVQNVYKKQSLPADYIEMLPEILVPLTTHYSADIQVLLFAKDAETNKWKTLDYFGNNIKTPIYRPIQNKDRKSVV